VADVPIMHLNAWAAGCTLWVFFVVLKCVFNGVCGFLMYVRCPAILSFSTLRMVTSVCNFLLILWAIPGSPKFFGPLKSELFLGWDCTGDWDARGVCGDKDQSFLFS
jgi:hypothetical protein